MKLFHVSSIRTHLAPLKNIKKEIKYIHTQIKILINMFMPLALLSVRLLLFLHTLCIFWYNFSFCIHFFSFWRNWKCCWPSEAIAGSLGKDLCLLLAQLRALGGNCDFILTLRHYHKLCICVVCLHVTARLSIYCPLSCWQVNFREYLLKILSHIWNLA